MRTKHVVAAVAGAAALLVAALSLVPDRYVQQAKRERLARETTEQPSAGSTMGPAAIPSGSASKLHPDWIRAVTRTGPSMIVTIDVSAHPRGQLVGTLGHRILDLAAAIRNKSFAVPDGIETVTIYGNVDLFERNSTVATSETAVRAFYNLNALTAATPSEYNNWTVFKLAAHTNQTLASRKNGLLDGFCESDFGTDTGDLCSN